MTQTIDTIGRAARHDMLVRVECLSCRHVGFHRAHELARLLGHGRTIAAIRFVCSKCAGREVHARALEFDRDRPPKVEVWVPRRLTR